MKMIALLPGGVHRMYNVLIVDDEPQHRSGLSMLIRRYRPEASVFEARNGKEALECLEDHRIPIVFTDIKMPTMDGLQFMEQLGPRTAWMKIVILSGYGLFQYAQKAFRLGAMDYILKPVDEQQVMEMLDKIDDSLRRDQQEQNARCQMLLRLSESRALYEERVLNDWLNGALREDDHDTLRALLPPSGAGAVAVLSPDPEDSPETGEPDRRTAAAQQEKWSHVGDKWNECMEPFGPCLTFPLQNDQTGMASVMAQDSSSEQTMSRLSVAAERFLESMAQERISLSVGLGGFRPDLFRQGPESWREANRALALRFYRGGQRVFRYDEWPQTASGTRPFLQPAEEEALRRAVRELNVSELKLWICGAFDRIAANPSLDPEPCIEFARNVILSIIYRLRDRLEEADYVRFLRAADLSLSAVRTFAGLKEAVCRIAADVVARLNACRNGSRDAVVRRCLEYIEKHYMRDISLESVADAFKFNASYFSMYFKQHQGVTFSQYVLQYRLEKAKELLLGTPLKVYEIAERVGFRDVKYFNRVFKKEIGWTPETYRRLRA